MTPPPPPPHPTIRRKRVHEKLSWKEQRKKIAKNIERKYRAELFLDKESLLVLYYSYIHSYANSAWGSTYRTNLKKLRSQQKHAIRIVHSRTKFEHTEELLKSANVMNFYKLNILSIGVFIHRVHIEASPPVSREFLSLF